MPTSEILTQHQSATGPRVLWVRGTLVVSSLQTLRELNLIDRYLQCLPAANHDQLLFAPAASWLPVDLAMKHYLACETMALPEADLDNIGRHVSERIMGTFLGTIMRSSRTVGATLSPIVPLRQYSRLWDRLLMGGACKVSTSGPKDARIESRGVPMFRYRYFRIAYTGLIRGAGLMFAKVIHLRVRSDGDDALIIDASWV
jgi:hypothetical protein